MSGGIVIAGGSKQPSVASRTSGAWPRAFALNFLSAVVLAAIIAFWI
jgi:hypothetical protein